jgi:hypothetical protein
MLKLRRDSLSQIMFNASRKKLGERVKLRSRNKVSSEDNGVGCSTPMVAMVAPGAPASVRCVEMT